MGNKEDEDKTFPKVRNQKIMWAIAAVFLMISVTFCYFGYQTPDPNIASIDDVEEWAGVLPDYEELEGELEGEKGTWVKSDFYLNEGMIGTFDCTPHSGGGIFLDEGEWFVFEETAEGPFNISIVWDDPQSDGLLALNGWIDLHPNLDIQGATNEYCWISGSDGPHPWELTPWKGDGYNVTVEDDPIPLRGLFLIIDGEEGEDWYIVSIGHDKNGGFDVEPFVSDSGLSKYLWGLGFAIPGLAILYWSFDPRNK